MVSVGTKSGHGAEPPSLLLESEFIRANPWLYRFLPPNPQKNTDGWRYRVALVDEWGRTAVVTAIPQTDTLVIVTVTRSERKNAKYLFYNKQFPFLSGGAIY